MHPNEAVIRRWFEELWNQKKIETIDELFKEDTRAFGLADDAAPLVGREAFRQSYLFFTSVLPDLQITVDQVVVDGDSTATRFTVNATHTGDQFGFPGTGKPVSFTGMTFARIENGQIAEGWNTIDLLAMMQQLGAAPRLNEFTLLPINPV